MTGLFDTHTHLADPRYDGEIEAVIERMLGAGVSLALVMGDGAEDPEGAFALASRYSFLYAAVGVHPHDASALDDARLFRLRGWMAGERVVALGEIGLDYYYDRSPREAQRAAFAAQLELAEELRAPIILHVRDAHGDATELISARKGRLPSGVMHCYTGSWESAKRYLDMGLYISLSGAVTFKNAPKLREVAEKLPADRLLIETDCPYLSPEPLRGRRNEPAHLRYTAERVAEIRGIEPEELAASAAANGRRLFGIPAAGPN